MERPIKQCPECAISDEAAREILETGEYCVVATVDEDGAPYCTPLSYIIDGNDLYIHTGAEGGQKTDDWQRDARVCLTVAVDMEPVYERTLFTTYYASVIARGSVERVTDEAKIRWALAKLCLKYVPDFKKEIGGAINREIDKTAIWVVHLDSISGKAYCPHPNGKGHVAMQADPLPLGPERE